MVYPNSRCWCARSRMWWMCPIPRAYRVALHYSVIRPGCWSRPRRQAAGRGPGCWSRPRRQGAGSRRKVISRITVLLLEEGVAARRIYPSTPRRNESLYLHNQGDRTNGVLVVRWYNQGNGDESQRSKGYQRTTNTPFVYVHHGLQSHTWASKRTEGISVQERPPPHFHLYR